MAITAFLDLHLRADAPDDVGQRIGAILAGTRARPGSLGIEVLRDAADPAHVTVVERWASMADDDAYPAWRATPEGASGLGDLLDRQPVLSHHETWSSL